MIVTEEQKKEIKKYGVDIDKLIKNGDVNEVSIKSLRVRPTAVPSLRHQGT